MVIEIAEAQGEDTQEQIIAPRDHSRDDAQKWVDTKVQDLVKRYHEAHDPEPSRKAPYLRLEVKKEDRAELRTKINRAFTLVSANNDTNPLWSEGTEVPALVPRFYLDGKGTDGKVVVKFNVQPKPLTKKEREAKAEAEAKAKAEAEAKAKEQAHQGQQR